jgi:transposase
MVLTILYPHLAAFHLCSVTVDEEQTTFTLRPKGRYSKCPVCNRRSGSLHSHYTRTLMDLPICGIQLRLALVVRRFRCHRRKCSRAIFCERLTTLAPAYARSTHDKQHSTQEIGLALGGNPGARLAAVLNEPASASTVLRRIHAVEQPAVGRVRVLGVDDWAFLKGKLYGTILCDLEFHRAIDLLSDRSAESLARWLAGHPEIEIISRDRGGIYAQGAAAGAPQAQQVADRFHLLKNMADALRKVLDRHHSDLKAISEDSTIPVAVPAIEPELYPPEPIRSVPPTAFQQRRQALFDEIRQLVTAGHSEREISRRLRISRVTVKRYAAADSAPPIVRTDYPFSATVLAGFTEMIDQRIRDGEVNLTVLFNGLRADGYRGSKNRVCVYVRKYHSGVKTRRSERHRAAITTGQPRKRRLSARSAVWLLLRNESKLTAKDAKMRANLINADKEIAAADGLAQRFAEMVRKRLPEKLDAWLSDAEACLITELRNFAKGLSQDYAAVKAGITMAWSNGPVEGHINRLKLVKRTMYGRAGMDLLKKRYLCTQ